MNGKSSGSRSRKQRLTAVGTRCVDHVTPLYPQKLALTSPPGGGRSVGIVRVRTKATEFSLVLWFKKIYKYRYRSGILNNVFRPQKKLLRKKNKTNQYTGPSGLVIWQRN